MTLDKLSIGQTATVTSVGGEGMLRQRLLEEVYAGGFSGLGAMLLDEAEIRAAGPEELERIARRYGVS